MHVSFTQSTGGPQLPVVSHVWTPFPAPASPPPAPASPAAHWVWPGAQSPAQAPATHVWFVGVQLIVPPHAPVEPQIADELPRHPIAPGVHATQRPARQDGSVPLQAASATTHWPPEHVSGVEPTHAPAPLVHTGAGPASPSGPSGGASTGAPSDALASPEPESTSPASLAPSLAVPLSLAAASWFTPESPDVASTPPSPPPPEDEVPPELPHAVRRTKSGTHRIHRMATLLP
jgi:hypothetical protein